MSPTPVTTNQRKARFVVSADWHFGERVYDAENLRHLTDSIAAAQPDFILVLGDFVNLHQTDTLTLVFSALARLDCPVGLVFGNHDILVPTGVSAPANSWEALDSFCDLARQAGLHPLDKGPLLLGDLFICGVGGWYDYSFGDSRWSAEQFASKRYGDLVWSDVESARWEMADQEVSAMLTQKLDYDLKQLPRELEPIAVTHMAALQGSLPYPTNTDWDFFAAYWGSKQLGDILGKHQVRLHLHGHAHSDRHPIPEMAIDHQTGLRSYNTSYYLHRPYLVFERDDSEPGWTVRGGRLSSG